jgi:hypothetical protein
MELKLKMRSLAEFRAELGTVPSAPEAILEGSAGSGRNPCPTITHTLYNN